MEINLKDIQWDFLSDKNSKWIQKKLFVTPFKQSGNRCVYYHPEGIFIKTYSYQFVRSILRNLRGRKALREGLVSLELKKRKVSVPDVIGFGSIKSKGRLLQDFFITREVKDAMLLRDFHEKIFPELSFGDKYALIISFAEFIKHLHRFGVYHRDINFGNIIVKECNNKREFVLLDLDKVELYKKPLDLSKCTENLGVLLQMFWPSTTLAQQFRFYRAYGNDPNYQHINAVRRVTLQKNYQRGKTISRQSRTTNPRFIKTNLHRFTMIQFRNENSNQIVQYLEKSINDASNKDQIIPFQDNKTIDLKIDNEMFEISIFDDKKFFCQIQKILIGSKGMRAWMSTFGFLLRKISIFYPLVFLEEKKGGIARRSCIFSAVPKNTLNFFEFWNSADSQIRKTAVIQLGIFIGRMHQVGCYHGNLSWDNILVRPVGTRRLFCLKNLSSSRVYKSLSFLKAAMDLNPLLKDLKFHSDKKTVDLFKMIWWKYSCYRKKSNLLDLQRF